MELGVAVLPAEEQGAPVVAEVQGAPVVEPEQVRAEQAAVQLEEAQEPEQAAVAGLVPALVRPQGQASARVQQLRSALDLMRPSVPVLVLQLVRVRLAGPGLVPVPVHPSVQVPAVRSGKEPVMAQLTGLGTKALVLKTAPASVLLRSARPEQIREQSVVGCVPLCSLMMPNTLPDRRRE